MTICAFCGHEHITDKIILEKIATIRKKVNDNMTAWYSTGKSDVEFLLKIANEANSHRNNDQCEWRETNDTWDTHWETSCGNAHCFICDGPKDNDFKFAEKIAL